MLATDDYSTGLDLSFTQATRLTAYGYEAQESDTKITFRTKQNQNWKYKMRVWQR